MLSKFDDAIAFQAKALGLRAYRQQVLAENIANADTPNYKARDFEPAELKYRQPVQSSADGNTVEMDLERAQFAENAVRYEAGLTFISGRIKTLLTAIQGQSA